MDALHNECAHHHPTTRAGGWCDRMHAREKARCIMRLRHTRGVPPEGPESTANGPQPHVRFGWARREAPLDAPVGFDGYSYSITDIRFETMHRSRPGKFFHPKRSKSKSAKAAALAPTPVTAHPLKINM